MQISLESTRRFFWDSNGKLFWSLSCNHDRLHTFTHWQAKKMYPLGGYEAEHNGASELSRKIVAI